MINDRIQRQEAGDGSTNYQAETITVVQGISYRDARDIALDVYQQNFIKLSEHAAQVALGRAEEFIDDFLGKIQSKNPALLEQMSQPSIQNSLYCAQKQYAVTGDKELKSLLLDLVVQRCEKEERSIHQIVLDEAIELASKITVEQMDALTVNFIVSRSKSNSIVSFDSMLTHIDGHIIPFIESLETETSCYEHLTYLGAATIEHLGNVPQLYEIYVEKYRGVFSKGSELSFFDSVIADDGKVRNLINRCLLYPNLFQVMVLNDEALNVECMKYGISDEIKTKLSSLMTQSTMSPLEAKVFLLEKRPQLNRLFDVWEKTNINKMFLTTVGIALAQANFQRRTGVELDLDIWVK
ncbi:LPO_1073/Vpar_1526 family protein [Aeromonas hydrophila]|uniref:LPO_1073/Vpar_1526 family protein n=1 Tax=Aeromonas hydrophila TaxID=644 RepID=UPI002B49C63B|nr:LPO_1073/Vpar_1526 family protein [Aeromonas hydrophila]